MLKTGTGRRRHMTPPRPVQDGSSVSLGTTSTHDAFPGVCRLATGAQHLICIYRQASDHGTTFDGILRKRTSTDNGATWSDPPVTIWNPSPDSAGGCCVVKLANDDLLVTGWKKLNGVSDWQAVSILSTDDGATWGSPVNITSSFTDWSICEGPAIQLPNGDLYAAMYGKDSGDTFESVRISKSTDGGASWAHFADVAEGDTFGRDLQEPQLLVMNNGTWLCMIRSDKGTDLDEIHYSLSYNQGVSWSTPRGAFAGHGRPNVFQRSSDGRMFCAYRAPEPTNDSWMKVSNDGIRWNTHQWISFAGGSDLYFAYGQWVELGTGQVAIVYSLQAAGGDVDASLWFSKVT